MESSLFDEHRVGAVINDLQVECAAISVLLIHLVSRVACEQPDPKSWVRRFGDDLHASVDRATAPTEPQAQRMAEKLRDRLDKLIHGIDVRIAG